jgi:hypothetical protein
VPGLRLGTIRYREILKRYFERHHLAVSGSRCYFSNRSIRESNLQNASSGRMAFKSSKTFKGSARRTLESRGTRTCLSADCIKTSYGITMLGWDIPGPMFVRLQSCEGLGVVEIVHVSRNAFIRLRCIIASKDLTFCCKATPISVRIAMILATSVADEGPTRQANRTSSYFASQIIKVESSP